MLTAAIFIALWALVILAALAVLIGARRLRGEQDLADALEEIGALQSENTRLTLHNQDMEKALDVALEAMTAAGAMAKEARDTLLRHAFAARRMDPAEVERLRIIGLIERGKAA